MENFLDFSRERKPSVLAYKEVNEMTDTNPTGSDNQSTGTVQEAADSFLGLLDAEEAPEEGQAEAQQEEQEEELDSDEAQDDLQDEGDEEESDEEPEEEAEEQEETPSVYQVKVNGEDLELTLDELKSYAQQGADYTKKTQQVAEERKAVQAERQAIEEAKNLRDTYAHRLQEMAKMLDSSAKGEDLDYLKETDPIGYSVKVAERQEQREQLQAVQQEQYRIAQQQQAEQSQQMQSFLSQQAQELSKQLPEYADAVKGEQLRSDMRDFAKSSLGFSDEDISNIRDSRQVLTLHKAMMYDKLQKAKPNINKKVSTAPKTLKSGNGVKPTTSDQVKRQKQQLKQSGKVRDAAKLFENFI